MLLITLASNAFQHGLAAFIDCLPDDAHVLLTSFSCGPNNEAARLLQARGVAVTMHEHDPRDITGSFDGIAQLILDEP